MFDLTRPATFDAISKVCLLLVEEFGRDHNVGVDVVYCCYGVDDNDEDDDDVVSSIGCATVFSCCNHDNNKMDKFTH